MEQFDVPAAGCFTPLGATPAQVCGGRSNKPSNVQLYLPMLSPVKVMGSTGNNILPGEMQLLGR